MPVEFNHTLVHARNREETAKFLSEMLGLPPPVPFGIFLVIRTANGVNLDVIGTDQPFDTQHYAFLVSETEFDEIFGRIKKRGLSYWADPMKKTVNQINHHDGGRGCYFEDPSGNFLEIITVPYGGKGKH